MASWSRVLIKGWSSLTKAAKHMVVSSHWPVEGVKMRVTASLTEWTVQTSAAWATCLPSTRTLATNDCGPTCIVRRRAS